MTSPCDVCSNKQVCKYQHIVSDLLTSLQSTFENIDTVDETGKPVKLRNTTLGDILSVGVICRKRLPRI